MNSKIPKIIHQVWSGIECQLPETFKILGDTWKNDYPDWKYELWDEEKMNSFILYYYPQYWDKYRGFPYDIQRWDVIRYMILDTIGGMYVDFDYESIEPLHNIIDDSKTCCFALEPLSHCYKFKMDFIVNNALMISIPNHPYIKKVIEKVFTDNKYIYTQEKDKDVFKTTGPWMMTEVYKGLDLSERSSIYLIPAKHVTPFDVAQAWAVKAGIKNQALEDCLDEAYAIHYFWGAWNN